MELLGYLLKVSVCLLIFFAVYVLFLRKLTFFRLNRFYLLMTLLLSFTVPMVHFTVERPSIGKPVTETGYPVLVSRTDDGVKLSPDESLSRQSYGLSTINWSSVLLYAYLSVSVILLLSAMLSLVRLLMCTRLPAKNVDGLKMISKVGGFTNCSFFNYVFIDDRYLAPEEVEMMLRHEKVHAQEFHSLDKLLVMLAKAILWFNPVIYLWDSVLEKVHEYEADKAVSDALGAKGYAGFLLKLAVVKNPDPLVIHFGRSPVKDRIKMLFNSKSNNMKKAVYVLVLPICMVLIWQFSVQYVYAQEKKAERKVTIVKNGSSQVEVSNIVVDGDTIRLIADTIYLSDQPLNYSPEKAHNYSPPRAHEVSTLGHKNGENITAADIENLTLRHVIVDTAEVVLDGNYKFGYAHTSSDADIGSRVTNIENDGRYTVVSFEQTAKSDDDWVLLNKEIYIQANTDMKHYQYVKSENIPLAPNKHTFKKGGDKLRFKVYFEKIPSTAKSIDVIERAGYDNFFNFYNIALPVVRN